MKRPEQALQKSIVEFLTLCAPDDLFWTAINPVPGKTPAIAGLCKAMGMRAGVLDLLFIWQMFPFFIECKADGGRLSQNQKDTIDLAARAGAPTYLCRSLDDVVRVMSARNIPMKGSIRSAA
jgi:hypothetical protein